MYVSLLACSACLLKFEISPNSIVSNCNAVRVKLTSKCGLHSSLYAVAAAPLLFVAATCVDEGSKRCVAYRTTLISRGHQLSVNFSCNYMSNERNYRDCKLCCLYLCKITETAIFFIFFIFSYFIYVYVLIQCNPYYLANLSSQ